MWLLLHEVTEEPKAEISVGGRGLAPEFARPADLDPRAVLAFPSLPLSSG